MVNLALKEDLVERVLSKLGLNAKPANSLEGLRSFYEAWCHGVPFDNSRKRIHVNAKDTTALPGSDAIDFFENWLKYGTGGTCWAGNGAMHALLTSLGYTADRGVATMLVAPDLPPNHGTVVVRFDAEKYIVDASILHVRPLHIGSNNSEVFVTAPWVKEFWEANGHWVIRWVPLHRFADLDCRIDYFPTDQADFNERHEKTRGWSPFNYELTVRKVKNGELIGICSGQRAVYRDGKINCTDLDEDSRVEFLVNELGLAEELVRKLPADIPTPPPPGSHAAEKLENAKQH